MNRIKIILNRISVTDRSTIKQEIKFPIKDILFVGDKVKYGEYITTVQERFFVLESIYSGEDCFEFITIPIQAETL